LFESYGAIRVCNVIRDSDSDLNRMFGFDQFVDGPNRSKVASRPDFKDADVARDLSKKESKLNFESNIFGFVNFATVQQATDAIKNLNTITIDGRKIQVRRKDAPCGGGGADETQIVGDPWLSIELPRWLWVVPSHYSLAAATPAPQYPPRAVGEEIAAVGYPRNWRIDGSADGSEWLLLRRHVYDSSLSLSSVSHTWPLDVRLLQGPVRFIRLVAEGPDSSGGLAFAATGFDLYGAVASSRDHPHLKPSLNTLAAYNHYSEAVAAQAGGDLEVAMIKKSKFAQARGSRANSQLARSSIPGGLTAEAFSLAHSAVCDGERLLYSSDYDPSYTAPGLSTAGAGGAKLLQDAEERFEVAEAVLRDHLWDVPGALVAALKFDESNARARDTVATLYGALCELARTWQDDGLPFEPHDQERGLIKESSFQNPESRNERKNLMIKSRHNLDEDKEKEPGDLASVMKFLRQRKKTEEDVKDPADDAPDAPNGDGDAVQKVVDDIAKKMKIENLNSDDVAGIKVEQDSSVEAAREAMKRVFSRLNEQSDEALKEGEKELEGDDDQKHNLQAARKAIIKAADFFSAFYSDDGTLVSSILETTPAPSPLGNAPGTSESAPSRTSQSENRTPNEVKEALAAAHAKLRAEEKAVFTAASSSINAAQRKLDAEDVRPARRALAEARRQMERLGIFSVSKKPEGIGEGDDAAAPASADDAAGADGAGEDAAAQAIKDFGLDDTLVNMYQDEHTRLAKMEAESDEHTKKVLERAFLARQQHKEALSKNDAFKAVKLLGEEEDLLKRADASDVPFEERANE